MGDAKLAKIVHRVAKMLVSLLEAEYGLGKQERQVGVVIVRQRTYESPDLG